MAGRKGYRKSASSGSPVHQGEFSGNGPVAGAGEVGNMGPGKVNTKKLAVKSYFEGGANSYSPKGMSKQDPHQDS